MKILRVQISKYALPCIPNIWTFFLMRKLTRDEFIRKAREVHGDKYDYSKVIYKTSRTKVCIICPIHGEFWQTSNSHLQGTGCPHCAISKRIDLARSNTEDFILKARKIHGWKFDYSRVTYRNNTTKICILCPEHGEFWMTPNGHLQGHECPKCASASRKLLLLKPFERFISDARKVHGNKYTYIEDTYKNGCIKMTMVCPEHGEFKQSPSKHIAGECCPECSKKNSAEKRKYTTQEFIAKARVVHGDKYNYEPTKYEDSMTSIAIECPDHGIFHQTPSNHLSGYGCPKCGRERVANIRSLTTEDFISRAMDIHGDKYDYTSSEYVNGRTEITIICPIHGSFRQKPESHLYGHGCPYCKESRGEKYIVKWMNEHNINYVRQFRIIPTQILFGRNTFIVDFFIPSLNTIIEFHGKQHYAMNPFFHKDEDAFQMQVDRDIRLREYCKQHKIRLIEIPYTEIDNIDKILDKKIK